MNSSISEVFNSFSKWLSKRATIFKKIKNEGQTKAKFFWYSPGNEDITILDREAISSLFEREDIQKAYKQWVKGEGVAIDSPVIRFQNASIAADEQAFRMRHATVPRVFSHGLMATNMWSDNVYKKVSTEYVKAVKTQINKDKTDRFG